MNADDIKALDFQNATVTLWFFKQPQKGEDGRPKYTGRWLEIDNEISEKLKESASITCDTVDDVSNFSLLGSTNDGKALSIQADETNADLIQGQTAGELPNKKISKVKEVLNSKFYVAKFIVGDSIILAFKKLDSTWSTKKSNSFISAAFNEATLTLAPENTFKLPKNFDFLIVNGLIIIANKAAFESVLAYKEAHKKDFEALLGEEVFSSCFTDTAPLEAIVGENKLLLRRACAVREKRHYASDDFMTNLRTRHTEFKLIINFDGNHKIIPCTDTCRDIFTALLDHRLKSGFSENFYDVTDTSPA
jgi:hypothetical protein